MRQREYCVCVFHSSALVVLYSEAVAIIDLSGGMPTSIERIDSYYSYSRNPSSL